jgi:hypothetical protein
MDKQILTIEQKKQFRKELMDWYRQMDDVQLTPRNLSKMYEYYERQEQTEDSTFDSEDAFFEASEARIYTTNNINYED